MKSFVVYKFTCASCSCNYIDETCPHFKTRIEEDIKKDNESHIFIHLHSTETCFESYNSLCFKIIDKANPKYDLKIKEAFLALMERLQILVTGVQSILEPSLRNLPVRLSTPIALLVLNSFNIYRIDTELTFINLRFFLPKLVSL